MRNRSVTQVLPSAAGQSVDVKQMLVEGNLDGVSGQKCSGARQTVMKQESPVIIFDLTAGVSMSDRGQEGKRQEGTPELGTGNRQEVRDFLPTQSILAECQSGNLRLLYHFSKCLLYI